MLPTRALLFLAGAFACSPGAPAVQPSARVAVAAPDPIEALRPNVRIVPYALDRSSVDGASLRDHYPLVGSNPAADANALGALRASLDSEFIAIADKPGIRDLSLELTPTSREHELAPNDADARALARFVALTDRIAPLCGRGTVRWLAPRIERTSVGHDASTSIVRRGFSGASDGYGLVTISASRDSDRETAPPRPWRVTCTSMVGEALRPVVREAAHDPAVLAHPDLRVVDHMTRSLGHHVSPEESCREWHARGRTCDPIGAHVFATRVKLPPEDGRRAITADDLRERIRMTPLVHLGCDGAARFVVRFDLAKARSTSERDVGGETEQTLHDIEMSPIVLDLVTGERLPNDPPGVAAWSVESGQVDAVAACPRTP